LGQNGLKKKEFLRQKTKTLDFSTIFWLKFGKKYATRHLPYFQKKLGWKTCYK
jgi:hypothetical protein